MKRHLLIILAVLVPFAGLVAFGFSLLKEPAPIELPAPVVRLEPQRPPPPPVRAPIRPPLPVEVPVIARPPPPPPVPAKPAPELSAEAKRLPIRAAVEPLVQQCFRDVSEHVREPMQVIVAFNTTVEGKFENIVLKKTSWQDPTLTACILDSFEDARFEPSGFALKRQSYTFTFAGPDGGF